MLRPGIELEGKRVLVVGLARTGVATALFCAARGARVTATEERGAAALGEAAHKLRDAGCALEFGGHSDEIFLAQDLIVPSPGVPASLPGLVAARAAQHSGVERNRTGLALFARPLRGHHRLERQDHDDLADRPHSARRRTAASSSREILARP